jgi:signal transduction histidine kinase
LIDNAIKYGGQQIEVSLSTDGKHVVWIVSDSGGEIDKKQQAHIFKKFYRIPKGNVHNVKGFGIGLYYTKTMVEKHEGNISLTVVGGKTKFKITI